MERFKQKHLLGIEELSRDEVDSILDTAIIMKSVLERRIKKVPTLRGITVANLFFEPSTRTLNSFLIAERRLSADTINVSMSFSSVLKGETLLDTARNLEAMRVDMVVIRHSVPCSPHYLAERISASVINAGDGAHEHPTQALLDMLTLKERFGNIEGLKVSIIGDILHSRVARSLTMGLLKEGADVILCGPPTFLPEWFEDYGVKITYNLKDAIVDRDVIYVLRIQRERQDTAFLPSLREYIRYYSVNRDVLNRYARKDVIIMHPGPVNRGVELAPDVADGPWSLILHQVTNGIAVRMAILYLLSGIGSSGGVE